MRDDTGPSIYTVIKALALPFLFTSCVWHIALYPTPTLPQLNHLVSWKSNIISDNNHNKMVPDTIYDAFKLGQIANSITSDNKDIDLLLQEANDILLKDRTLI